MDNKAGKVEQKTGGAAKEGDGKELKEMDVKLISGESSSPENLTVNLNLDETSNTDEDENGDDCEGWDKELLEEEQRIRKERESLEQQKEPEVVEAVLEDKKFKQLDSMLNQTGMYTQFLREQLEKMEEEMADTTVAEPEPESPQKGGKGGRKRKGRPKGSNTKRQKKTLTPTQELLPLVNGELRDYQLQGVRWLISLYQNGINGILADEMGLGKTIQTIGFLAHLRSKGINGPFIIIAPLSTLGNWVAEFQKWTPSIPVLLYHGDINERARLRATRLSEPGTAEFPVIVTTYEIIMNDVRPFTRVNFKVMVVDEGHRLKNFKCRLIRDLKLLTVANKVLLTGTPLQNNLSELWSILNFILPEIFDKLENFESWFDFSAVGQAGGDKAIVAAEQRNMVVSKLHSILKPFFLRRMKSDTNLKLPAKQEVILYAQMTDEQKKINKGLLDKTLVEKLQKEATRNGAICVNMTIVRNMMMQMRKNCNHPDLITGGVDGSTVYPPVEELVAQCGKLALMHKLLKSLRQAGHKVLIFSQMRRMLDIIDYYLSEQGFDACRIDGQVNWKDRQDQIQKFNKDKNTWLFLLSTRAGGLGINLTAADTVIIYDSDWNPQQDLQAIDRCHRIGQTRPVLVFRLATAHSVEGRMLQRAANKMVLERLVMKKGGFKGDHLIDSRPASMSAKELLALLRADVTLVDDAQSGDVSDEMLATLMNRDHLAKKEAMPYPQTGIGYEVVIKERSNGLLSSVDNNSENQK